MRRGTKPSIWEEVARAIEARLRALPPSDDSVHERDIAFATATVQASEVLDPYQDRTVPGHI